MMRSFLALACLLSGCAAPHPSGSENDVLQPLPVVVYADGQPQPRPVHFQNVRVGQAVVAGIHTVAFTVADADMAWIRELTTRHERVALHCEGREVWAFENPSSGEGYFQGRGATDEASAQRLAAEIQTKQCARGE